jgi:hypothetical protein
MAFADPQNLDIDGSGSAPLAVLPRVGAGMGIGRFSSTDRDLIISHQYGKRARRTARIDLVKVAPDPLVPATNVPYSASTYIVIDEPLQGFTDAEIVLLVNSLIVWLSTGSNTSKLVGGEA